MPVREIGLGRSKCAYLTDRIMVRLCFLKSILGLKSEKEYPNEEIEEDLIPWLLWRLWKNRNELLFRSKEFGAQTTVEKSRDDAKTWKSREEATMQEVKVPTTVEMSKSWIPPQPNTLKCNTDGSWKQENGEGEIGWVLRDHSGHMLWAGAKRVTGMGSVLEVEAEAMRWATSFLAGLRYRQITFETDSQVLSKMLRGEEDIWPRVKPIIQEIQASLGIFSECEVEYFSRSGNKVADRVAKETAAFSSFVRKLYSIMPSWLISCLETDKSSEIH